MIIRVFGMLEELIGKNELQISGVQTIADIEEKLFGEYPDLRYMKFSVAVNRKIIRGDIAVQDSDEIALLPPFSGG